MRIDSRSLMAAGVLCASTAAVAAATPVEIRYRSYSGPATTGIPQ